MTDRTDAPLDESLAWITLTRAPALDAAALSTALGELGGALPLLRCSGGALAAWGFKARTRDFLRLPQSAPLPAERTWLAQPGHHLVPFTDPRFPPLLRTQHGGPIALYVDGDPRCLDTAQIAVVGSRNPSPQGRHNARAFARHLAGCGLTVTSGMAEGIDAEAHAGALAAGGATIAVLGAGVDVHYPAANARLRAAVRKRGALVSEFALGTAPRAANFPQRNRIIAGLSLGTLVVEAARRSGSLITARLAADLGREVFAIPGSIHNPNSRGCHQLIRDGAKLTETADDILSELHFLPPADACAGASSGAGSAAGRILGMDKGRKILLDALGFDPADLDDLVVRTGLKPEAVSSMMLILELEGHVQAAPGGRYSRVARSP
jgi:DNA processing protein